MSPPLPFFFFLDIYINHSALLNVGSVLLIGSHQRLSLPSAAEVSALRGDASHRYHRVMKPVLGAGKRRFPTSSPPAASPAPGKAPARAGPLCCRGIGEEGRYFLCWKGFSLQQVTVQTPGESGAPAFRRAEGFILATSHPTRQGTVQTLVEGHPWEPWVPSWLSSLIPNARARTQPLALAWLSPADGSCAGLRQR